MQLLPLLIIATSIQSLVSLPLHRQMLDILASWTAEEMSPALRVMGELTMSALDSVSRVCLYWARTDANSQVPLPLLVVVFLALLASLKPATQPNLLPSYSPPLTSGMTEKTRLSPSPSSSPFFPLNPSLGPASAYRPPVYYAHGSSPALSGAGASSEDGKSTYVAVADNPSSAVNGQGRGARRGSARRFAWDRRRSSGLAVLQESALEEKAEV